jgi:hypothetical protein
MSLLNEIRQAQPARIGRPCSVGLALAAMTDNDAADLREALADDSITASIICGVLLNRGIDISSDVMRRHRRGGCRCGAQ